MLTVVLLTQDEARHIGRALASVAGIADRLVVVDSGSTDATVEIAQAAGAQVLHHPWRNYASQFNWALDQLPPDTAWVLRLDADEIVTPALAQEIATTLPGLDAVGVTMGRRISFLGQPIRWGGVFPIRVLRLFRHGTGAVREPVDGRAYHGRGPHRRAQGRDHRRQSQLNRVVDGQA